jgi:hypothetical protein
MTRRLRRIEFRRVRGEVLDMETGMPTLEFMLDGPHHDNQAVGIDERTDLQDLNCSEDVA